MDLPSYKPQSKPTAANTTKNHRKSRKSIFAISSTNNDAKNLDLRKNRKKQFNNTFKTGQIRYDQPIYLHQTDTPEREKRMAEKREHQNKYSASAWRNKENFGYDYNRPRSFQTFRNLDMERIPFKPITNANISENNSEFGSFMKNPNMSSTPFIAGKSSSSRRMSETICLMEQNTDDVLEGLAEKNNEKTIDRTARKSNFENETEFCSAAETLEPTAQWNPEMIKEKLSIRDLSEPEAVSNNDPNSSLLEEDQNRDIIMEMENYTMKLENIRGKAMFLDRKFPKIRDMLSELEENQEKSKYRRDDILGAWNNVVIEMDKVINRERNKSLAEIAEADEDDVLEGLAKKNNEETIDRPSRKSIFENETESVSVADYY